MGGFPLAFLQVCCHISVIFILSYLSWRNLAFVHFPFESNLNSNWNVVFRILLKFACEDQFPSSFSSKQFPMFVGIILFRHDPKTEAPLQSRGRAKAFCLARNVKCMLVIAFLHVPMSVPPLGILYALPRRFSTASCPPPLHLQRRKAQKGGEVGGKVRVEG